MPSGQSLPPLSVSFSFLSKNSVAYKRLFSPEDFPVLSHHHLDLVLDLRADVGRDVVGQLIVGVLEAFHHLLELANHRIACLLLPLFPVLHVILQLLDVCHKKETKETQESMLVKAMINDHVNGIMSEAPLKTT